jgi:hypothetical protein
VEESLISVEEAYSAIDSQNTRAVSSLNSLVTSRLDADDHVFGAMSKLALRTRPPPPQTVDPQTIQHWCDTLARLRESEASAKVDAAMHNQISELLLSDQGLFDDDVHLAQQEADLDAEIAGLRAEIGSVVEMAVASQLKKPILGLARSSRQDGVLAQHEWLCYILATLEHMINHLHTLGSCTEDLAAYTKAFGEVSAAWRLVDESDSTRKPSTGNTSPNNNNTTRLSRTRNNSSSALTSSATQPSVDFAAQIFRRFAIPTPASTGPSLSALAAASSAADARLQSQYITATAATAEIVGKALDKQRRDWQNVSQPIYAFSEHATVKLMPVGMEESIKDLDNDIERTANSLDGIERSNQ